MASILFIGMGLPNLFAGLRPAAGEQGFSSSRIQSRNRISALPKKFIVVLSFPPLAAMMRAPEAATAIPSTTRDQA
jgi:hypothetical protein